MVFKLASFVFFFFLTCLNTFVSAGETPLPKFVITNVDVQPNENGMVFFDAKTMASPSGQPSILLDIKKKGKGFEAKVIDRSSLQRMINADSPNFLPKLPGFNEQALICVHGFNVPPDSWLEECAKYTGKYGRTAIPVIWACEDRGLFGYDSDRVSSAPGAAEAFRKLLHTATPFRKSILCHSMGNFVLSLAAKAGANVPFEDIFMVAADVRQDVFDQGKNDSPTPSDNDGLEIASLAKNKVHVMFSNKDWAMVGRRFSPENMLAPALGANGFDESKLHPSLKGKVINVDCASKSSGEGLEDSSFLSDLVQHGYYFKNKMIEYYETVMQGKM